MLGGGMNLVTTVIGFGMSGTFIVFVCTRIICGRLRRAEQRPMFEIESRTDLEQPEPQVSGLEPVLVAAIPTMKFDNEAFSSMEDPQCSICLAEYQEKEVLRIMPKCGHTYHLSCIDVWLRKQSTCPVCRLPLQDFFGRRHMRPPLFDIPQSLDDPANSTDNSQRWLLPGLERSVGNVSTEGHVESVLVNQPESTPSREAERR
ncbi:RING-H2 finger protein ATL64-like isoform X1 [Carya illinoinensis]|uniref:RING-type domain-containing protein n=2 Tax=Carya illinoinensis TaxID=32201 RepID=A0A8T1RI55_CARIL|nr:RING-H2 finger protein ATL64-like isoform X1 [Carya illinoinensis]KAG6666737.1 hypothetical protein CIPAW_01G053700 [Carya illinoinensis]KAG6729837.1 hypothetical protein I3842_01G051200 [Carya illinoinensis]